MKGNRFFTQVLCGLVLAAAAAALSGCGNIIYHEPEYQYSNRAVPPSGLLQRVMATYSANGSAGGAVLLDGLRDTRTNVQDTIMAFPVGGFTAGMPATILNFPEQETGYILDNATGSMTGISYATEKATGSVAGFGANVPSVAAAYNGSRFVGAVSAAGVIGVKDSSGVAIQLALPNVDKVVINQGNSVILAMVRNSNTLYRIIHLSQSTTPVIPPGSIDCEPLLLPVYCVVPVGNLRTVSDPTSTVYDRPVDAYFSLDGTSVYILNCGPECGGSTAGVTVLQSGPLQVDQIPTVDPGTLPAPLQAIPGANPIAVPGGVTKALSDGTTLYLAGQQLGSDGLFAGNLSTVSLTSYAVTGKYSISDGTHTRMLFADNNTLWIGSSQCANGERQKLAAQQLAAGQATTQAANYNCLTLVNLGTSPTVQIVPAVTQGGSSPVAVPYPNENQDLYYYGSLTGLCWVQDFGKVYTAYGGQIHAFYTGGVLIDSNTDQQGYGTTPAGGTEVNNQYITIQGTALDVAYIDALTNSAN